MVVVEVTLTFEEKRRYLQRWPYLLCDENYWIELDENAVVHIEAIQIPDTVVGDERKEEIVGIVSSEK